MGLVRRKAKLIGLVAISIIICVTAYVCTWTLKEFNLYRLGDMVRFHESGLHGMTQEYAENHRETIGGEYMLRAPRRNYRENMHLLADIVARRTEGQPTSEVVVHVRLGDVLCDRNDYKHPVPKEQFVEILKKYIRPGQKVIFLSAVHGHSFFKRKNCSKETREYMRYTCDSFPGSELSINGDPDADFGKMVSADLFIAGRGGFSEVAGAVRKHMGRATVLDPILCPAAPSGY